MIAVLRLLALVAVLALAAGPGLAEEIRAFDVEIEVLPDGTLEVTEAIRVTVEGDQIKRGIIRDFPVEYREEDGRVSLVSFEVLGVSRNGQPEPYSRSQAGAYARIRIGRKDVLLPVPSEQLYEIRYRTRGQLRAHGGYDELYWNVTGNEWTFPIHAASVVIRLPDGTPILQHAGYTGPRGETGRAYEVEEAADGIYRARITAPLGVREGFTVAVGWPPGAVEIPPVRYGAAGAGPIVSPYPAVGATLIGTVLLLLGWMRVGRDPKGGAIYPEFDPPAGLSPAAMRYVDRMGFDPRCLTAAILSMAVKGTVRIVERPKNGLFGGHEYTLEPLGMTGNRLSPGERSAYRQLFPNGGAVTLKADETNGKRVDKARAELRSKLWDEHYGASFRRNTLYTLGGIAAGIGMFLVLAFLARWHGLPMVHWALSAVMAGSLAYGVGFLWFEADDLWHGGRMMWRRLAKMAPFLLLAGFFVYGNWFQGWDLWSILRISYPIIPAAGAAFGVAAALFHFLMAAPSKAGRQLMDRIEGFRLYMRTAEEDRLEILNPPEKTPELFERLLPYAVALGVSHQWSAKFAAVLAAAGATAPVWYSGTSRFSADEMEQGFSQAVSSTTVPSRGSGGSGGGGFSGGGGGGGGGSGW